MLGAIQATEALKYALGAGDPLSEALSVFAAKTMDFKGPAPETEKLPNLRRETRNYRAARRKTDRLPGWETC
jgi:hypothetical protein